MVAQRFGSVIEKALAQARLRKECKKSGGCDWEPMEPVDIDGSTFDVRCRHCGCWANETWEKKRSP